MYTISFTVLVWYMYINNNNNKRYHRNRETIDTSDTCIHDRSLYWSGTCTLIIIIIIKDIIETEKQSIPLTHVYNDRSLYWSGTCTLIIIILLLLLLMYMYQTSTVNDLVYMCQRYPLFLCFYDIFYYYYY
jgi:hypothetical protein